MVGKIVEGHFDIRLGWTAFVEDAIGLFGKCIFHSPPPVKSGVEGPGAEPMRFGERVDGCLLSFVVYGFHSSGSGTLKAIAGLAMRWGQ